VEAGTDRPDPLPCWSTERNREPDLVPVRHGRCWSPSSPFTFYRGLLSLRRIMASDLAETPVGRARRSVLCGEGCPACPFASSLQYPNRRFDLDLHDSTRRTRAAGVDVKRMRRGSFTVRGPHKQGFCQPLTRRRRWRRAAYREAMAEFALMADDESGTPRWAGQCRASRAALNATRGRSSTIRHEEAGDGRQSGGECAEEA